jgi:hypothetical protein
VVVLALGALAGARTIGLHVTHGAQALARGLDRHLVIHAPGALAARFAVETACLAGTAGSPPGVVVVAISAIVGLQPAFGVVDGLWLGVLLG